jgi:surface polysaccharide O-acyltransferase-like enzyme
MKIETAGEELVWPNVAKAACILFVVMMHSGDHILALPWAHKDQLTSGWMMVNGFIRPIRMPLFFLVSGLLASSSMLDPRPDTENNRLVRPIYLYAVWGVIYQLLIPLKANPTWFLPSINNSFLLIAMLMVTSWYLAALAIYYLFTKITLQLPLALVLVLAAGLSVLGTIYEPSLAGNQPKVLRCVIFFVAGVRMKDALLAFVETGTAKRALMLGACYSVGSVIGLKEHKFLLPVDMVAVAFGATLCGLAARRFAALAAPATWLARRTLPIYLIHFLLLPVLADAMATWAGPVLQIFWVGAAYPILAVPVIVAGSLAAQAVLLRLSASWLFELPWRDRAARSPLVLALPAARTA